MKIWFDTEFIEDGHTIDLISIGMVDEEGNEYYAESSECDLSRASPWVKDNVLPHLAGADCAVSREQMAHEIVEFAETKPEFWAYFCSYDWVVLCQLYGTMMDLPAGWPMYCCDLKQAADMMNGPDFRFPKQTSTEHHALADARWTRDSYRLLHPND